MIPRKAFFILGLLALPAGSSGEENAEKMNGVMGATVTFLLNTSEQFKKMTWLKSKGKQDVEIFAVAIPQTDPKERCELSVEIVEYKGRLSVSENCKRLQINDLSQEDSGTYTAQIQISDGLPVVKETFPLRVYKRLVEADLEIRCDRKGSHGGNGTLQLNCSAGRWEDDATFSWAPADLSESTGRSLVTRHNLEGNDLNFTCIVQNPVSKASKTVSFQETCHGSSGEENAEKMKGILGESVTFQLNTSDFKKIFWFRTKEKQNVEIFLVAIPKKDPEESCELSDEIPEYSGRLIVSEDCKRLQINNLSQKDSGTYTAQIQRADGKETIIETFPLRVYRKEACSENISLNLLAVILTVEKVAIIICAGVLMWWKKQRGDAADPKAK